MTITITIPDDDWRELEDHFDQWGDESYVLHAGYYLREALVREGYMEEE